MERTRPDSHYAIIPNRAHGYSISASGKLQNCALADTSNKVPGGGLLSTPEDLVRFALALRRGALLRASYVDLMFTPTYTRDHQRVNYALGWKVSSFDHHSVVWHDGGQQGVSTVLVLLPKERLSIALMCNLERVKLYDLAARIAHFMLDTPAPDETTARRRTQ
jgi:CubicO group peptidase (beta-lactamase class C family)